jgi:prepilin-type N-terminal cleavage/methylation domain-containing protein
MKIWKRTMLDRGFTLIELLIVIAIILILIAIALPNFLEAQERARVTRAKAQLRTFETAVYSHIMDYGYVYADFNDSFLVTSITRNKRRLERTPCGVQGSPVPDTSTLNWADMGLTGARAYYAPNIHCPLTTPIRYLNAKEVTDPWGDGNIPIGMDSREIGTGDIPGRKLSPENGSTLVYAAYFVAGPNKIQGEWRRGCDRGYGCAYNATNGTSSKGDLWMCISTVSNDFAKREYYPLKTF